MHSDWESSNGDGLDLYSILISRNAKRKHFFCSDERIIRVVPYEYVLFSSVPVLGYIVRDLNMCLLARNWESDRKTFDEYLENYIQSETPTCAYICPEGTTFTHHSFERSQSYAKKSNRPVLQVGLLSGIDE